jgi:hypothetical protein
MVGGQSQSKGQPLGEGESERREETHRNPESEYLASNTHSPPLPMEAGGFTLHRHNEE